MRKIFITVILVLVIIIVVLISTICLLFPVKYKDYIAKYSKEYSLDEKTIYSVINIESGFKKDSVSSAGAIGLMQVLPSTAEEVAKKLGLKWEETDLFDEETNILIGCYYLRYLLDLYDNNIINALCAYNWGLSNVNNWITLGNVLENGTITNIPVKETKNYISKYKLNVAIYSTFYRIK